MNFLGLDIPIKNIPELDKTFVPLSLFFSAHQKAATQPFAVAVERTGGLVAVYDTKVIGTPEFKAADEYYLDRLVKFLLWSRGGFKVTLCGNSSLAKTMQAAYEASGTRAFDKTFMERVYNHAFEVVICDYSQKPSENESSRPIGRNMDGYRIGFDAGGSDRKVSAVANGETVYSEEVVWFPKEQTDPDYHFNGIVQAMKAAASHLPQVDAIGVSSAGVYVDNLCRVASLFIKVSDEDFKKKAVDIYLRAAAEIGNNIPIEVVNDGDVTALAGAMGLNDVGVLGIAMGTSEAVGYVDSHGNITGWLNELAFAPVDGQPAAMKDEWSGDIGCGSKYFSQDGVIKLATAAKIPLVGTSQAEKLKEVQALMDSGDETAAAIYRSIGCYLAHALALYDNFYDIRHILVLGRVSSGKGGDILLAEAARVLKEEYPQHNFAPKTPDEKTRRVGQSVAAATLPKI